LEILTLLSQEEIEELVKAIKMKPGHKKKFQVVVKEAGEKRSREKEELEEKRSREKEELEEKRQREKEEREREKDERQLEQELAKIDRERRLQQARRRKDVDEHSKASAQLTATKAAELGMSVPKSTTESKGLVLPANKSYAAFISHKKKHSKHGDSSETLAIRLKVILY
jgi:hypothetical protein